MVLIKKLKFFHLFIFGKISQQKLFEDILESKKAFLNQVHVVTTKNNKLYHHFMAYTKLNFYLCC